MTDLTKYLAAAHAMQAGVATEMNYNSKPTEPKHLRVGINTCMVDIAALVGLLVKKGVITQEEYYDALTTAMETEKDRYEKHVSKLVGVPVTLA